MFPELALDQKFEMFLVEYFLLFIIIVYIFTCF